MARRGATPAASIFHRRRTAVATTVLAFIGLVAGGTPAYGTPAIDAGRVTVVTREGSKNAIAGGGSATEFSIMLPAGASCPGDSAHDGYRVQSFIVPAADDPGSLRWRSIAPEGPGRYALYDVFTSPYVQMQTAEAETVGGPGRIVNVPTFSFAVFPPGELSVGPHRIGIACTLMNETVKYWEAEVALKEASTDRPAGFRWTVLAIPSPKGTRKAPVAAIAASAAIIAGLIAIAIARRRHQPPASATSTEVL